MYSIIRLALVGLLNGIYGFLVPSSSTTGPTFTKTPVTIQGDGGVLKLQKATAGAQTSQIYISFVDSVGSLQALVGMDNITGNFDYYLVLATMMRFYTNDTLRFQIGAGGSVTVPTAPEATANNGLLTIGSGPVDGTTSGFFVGSTLGTGYASNFASGYAGSLVDLQIAGVQKFGVNSAGWRLKDPGLSRVTADATNATATMANLTDLAQTLIAGRKYVGELVIKCSNSTAAEGISIDFDGGAATMTSFAACAQVVAGGTSVGVTTVSSALATDLNFTTITNETWIRIPISLVCNAAGTFIPRFCEGAAHVTGTATVSLGSYLRLQDSPN